MPTNNLKENDIEHTTMPLTEGYVVNCLWEVSGGVYTGCGVGGWINNDGDTSSISNCLDSRFDSPC